MFNADIDIDVKSHTKKGDYGIRAIKYVQDKLEITPHPSGYYVDTNIPIDHETGYAAIDYKHADEMGYVKIDLLTNSSYDNFENKQQLLDAFNQIPDWDMLSKEEVVKSLPQIYNHFELLQLLQPRSIDDLADFLALIRPAKQKYIQSYIQNKEKVRKNLYKKPKDNAPYFKKSHSYAYAGQIICLLNRMNPEHLFIF